jgi:uncharacterized membrane protein YGL010W
MAPPRRPQQLLSSSPSWCLQQLKLQHVQDLKVYRNHHKEWRNLVLHWIMIPLECWSALLVTTVVLVYVLDGSILATTTAATVPSPNISIFSSFGELIALVTGIGLGVLSWMIATKRWIGFLTFVFHCIAMWTCHKVVTTMSPMETLSIALGVWTMAWMAQVGIGHWLWERNQPNVANMDDVSWLAMWQSVLIAWSTSRGSQKTR